MIFRKLILKILGSKIPTVDVAEDFHGRLSNRDESQGDGRFTAVEFREKFLKELDNQAAWEDKNPFICFDFKGVTRISPSFASEAFAYFSKYTRPKTILKKITFKNISYVKMLIIEHEVENG